MEEEDFNETYRKHHRKELKATLNGEARLRKKHDDSEYRVKTRRDRKITENRLAESCADPDIARHLRLIKEEGRVRDQDTLREIAKLVVTRSTDPDISAGQMKLIFAVIDSVDREKTKWKDKMCVDIGFVPRIIESFSIDAERCTAHVAFARLAARLASKMWTQFFDGVVKWLLPFVENTTPASDKHQLVACKRVSKAICDILEDGNVIVSEQQMALFFGVFMKKAKQFFSKEIPAEFLKLIVSLVYTIAHIADRTAIMFNRENVTGAFLEQHIPQVADMASTIISIPTMPRTLQVPALKAIVACLELGDNCPIKRMLVFERGIIGILLRSNLTAAEDGTKYNDMYVALELIAKTNRQEIATELYRSGAIEHCMLFALKSNGVDIYLRECMIETVRRYVRCTVNANPDISKFVCELARQEFEDPDPRSGEMCVVMQPFILEYLRVTSIHASENPNYAQECITWVVIFLNDTVRYGVLEMPKARVLREIKLRIGEYFLGYARIRDAYVDDVGEDDNEYIDFDECGEIEDDDGEDCEDEPNISYDELVSCL